MCGNDWEELSNVREENRTLSITLNNGGTEESARLCCKSKSTGGD